MADQKDIEKLKAELEKEIAEFRALKASMGTGGGLSKADLKEIVAAANKPASVLAEKLKPENADHRHLGPFENKEGGIVNPKPPLHRETYFPRGIRLRMDEITPAEVDAVNALSNSLGRAQRRTARDGKWVAEVSDDNQRLFISVPTRTIDDRADLPSFVGICMELTNGERVLTADDLAAEVATLRAKVQALEGASA